MNGLIFNVRRYSINDGPGIRVAFFMKGCPLSCWWCHNPEGISAMQEPVVVTRRLGDREFRSEEPAGKFYSTGDLISIAERERVFIQESGGGVTFTGGEPMLQPEFLLEALKAFRNAGFHTAVDTSGYAPEEKFREILPFTDLFMYDIKHPQVMDHIKYTGVANDGILGNLAMILRKGKDVWIRIPVVPGVNDNRADLEEIRSIIMKLRCDNLLRISLLPFHRTGTSKYRALGLQYKMGDTAEASPERMKELAEFFAETGINVRTGA